MLDGLEITELSLEDILKDNQHLRIDSEYFKKEFINFYLNVPNIDLLGSFVEEGYRVVYENTKILNKEEAISKNFPIFLQATDLQTPFIKKDNFYYVDEKDWVRYPMGRIKSGELLIEVKGKIEKVAIVSNDFPEKVLVSGSLYKMTVRDTINKYYLLVYLISKYGSAFKDRSKTNLLIPFLSKDDLFNIPIPIFSNSFQTLIETLIKNANIYSEESQKVYKAAETLLLTELDLQDFKPTEENTSVRTIEDSFLSSWRLDAEYYQPKYDEFFDLLLSHAEEKNWEVETLGNLSEPLRYGSSSKLEYTESGVPFLRIADLNGLRFDPKSLKYVSEKDGKGEKTSMVQTNDVLISRSGTLGLTIAIPEYLNNSVFGSYFIRVRPKIDILPEFLALYLNSMAGKLQVEQVNTGGIQTNLTIPVIENLKIVLPPKEIQQKFIEEVAKSVKTEDESKRLLDLAKTAVEIAIEQSEEDGIKLINDNLNQPQI